MGKKFRWLIAVAWAASTVYLLFGQIQLAFPFYAFFALFRAGLWFCVFVNALLAIAMTIAFMRKRFTTRLLMLLTAMVSISLALGISLYENTAIKTGFAYSKTSLTDCLSYGEIGDACGIYRIRDIERTSEYTIIFTSDDRSSYDPDGFIKFTDSTKMPDQEIAELRQAGFFALGNGWYVFYSYYNSIKMGWS